MNKISLHHIASLNTITSVITLNNNAKIYSKTETPGHGAGTHCIIELNTGEFYIYFPLTQGKEDFYNVKLDQVYPSLSITVGLTPYGVKVSAKVDFYTSRANNKPKEWLNILDSIVEDREHLIENNTRQLIQKFKNL